MDLDERGGREELGRIKGRRKTVIRIKKNMRKIHCL